MMKKQSLFSFAVFANTNDRVNISSGYSRETLPSTLDGSPLLLEETVYLRHILDVEETKQQIRYVLITLYSVPSVEIFKCPLL